MAERQYGAVQVLGKAKGMNQMGWEGSIDDGEATYLYNMAITKDGEWEKRKGYFLVKAVETAATPAVAKLHWHTDEIGNYADGSSWVETGDEITAASSGALAHSGMSLSSVPVVLDGEPVSYIYPTAAGSYVKMKSSFNFNATAGRLSFYCYLQASGPLGWTSENPPPPGAPVYLFYGSANFHIYINTVGDLIWVYGTGATEFLNLGPLSFNTFTSIDVRWDNDTTNTHWAYRFQAFVNGVSVAYADPTNAVTLSFDTDVYFSNTGSSGTSALYASSRYTIVPCIGFIRTWDASSATLANDAITGIHNNSSQQRALVTTGIYSPAAGKIRYSPAFSADVTGTYGIAGVRTDATEFQGLICIVDGTTTMETVTGSATAVDSETTLPETAKWIEEYHGHLWIAGLGTSGAYSVRCSDIDSISSWTSVNQVFKCRDTVRGIKAYQGQLIVGTRSTIESITGYQPHDFAKTILATANCASNWSMCEVPLADGSTSGLIWAGYDGIYMMVGQAVTKISWPIQDFWESLSRTEMEESHAVDCRERGEYMLAVSDGSSTDNNYILVFNYRRNAWSIWKYAHKMDVLGKCYASGVETIYGGDSAGNIFMLNRGEDDNGAAIDGFAITKYFDGMAPDQDKDFRKLYVWYACGGTSNIEVGWSTNYTSSGTNPDYVVGTNGNDYRCILAHEPSVVVGTDGNDYYCIDAHTSGDASKPITGGSYASYWTATGTTGRGGTWATSTDYVSNDDKKPITGGQYLQYWVPNHTIGKGSTWSASTGYKSNVIKMNASDTIVFKDENEAVVSIIAKFGTAVFGTDVFALDTGFFATAKTQIAEIDLYNARGKAIQFLFRNENALEQFSIRGFKVWYTYVPEFPA